MKILTLGIIVILTSINILAQTGANFGIKGGYSMATQYGIHVPDIPYTVEVAYRHGFIVGFMAYFPITESFGVQQEVLYVQKGSREDINMLEMPVKTHTEYDLNYFEIPIVLRYTFARLWDINIYGSTGFALSIMLDGQYRLTGQVFLGEDQESEPFSYTSEIKYVDIFDYSFLYGAGIEFDLFDKKCFFEYRFTIGWNTLMMPTVEGGDPAPLRNMDYIFVLGFML
jgi:hypothetical protein